MEALEVRDGLLGRAEVGLADDLDKRDASPGVVDAGDPGAGVVDGLASVLLEVNAGEAAKAASPERHRAAAADRAVQLGNLVAARQIRIRIMLAIETAREVDLAAERQPEPDREADRLGVRHRQGAGQAERHRVEGEVRLARLIPSRLHPAVLGRGVRRSVRGVRADRARGEELRRGPQLSVDLEPDDGFPGVAHGVTPDEVGQTGKG